MCELIHHKKQGWVYLHSQHLQFKIHQWCSQWEKRKQLFLWYFSLSHAPGAKYHPGFVVLSENVLSHLSETMQLHNNYIKQTLVSEWQIPSLWQPDVTYSASSKGTLVFPENAWILEISFHICEHRIIDSGQSALKCIQVYVLLNQFTVYCQNICHWCSC